MPPSLEKSGVGARWYYANSEDAEHWSGGCETREQAIAAGRVDYPDDDFWIESGSPMKHNLDVFDNDVESVMSAFQTKNEELFGEDGQGDPEVEWTSTACAELATSLNEAFAAWARKYGFDKAYMLDLSGGEHIPAPATGDPA